MQIQFITTHEEMQKLFDSYHEKSLLSYQPNNSTPAPVILSGDELCQKLDITIQTLIRWRHKGKVPFLQIGSSIRYDLNQVIKALEVGNKKKGVAR